LRILTIAAHPDDEVLGAGGALARHAEAGDELRLVVCGEGVTSRYDQRDQADPDLLKNLQEDMRRASKILGVARVYTLNLPDNRFDAVDLLDIVKAVETVVDDFEPDVVYTHHPGDLNIDHRLTFQAAITALRPLPGRRTSGIYCFEIPSATGWATPASGLPFEPNHYVEVSGWISKKLEALRSYAGEIPQPPHARSEKAVEARARMRGAEIGVEFAEAFVVARSICFEGEQ